MVRMLNVSILRGTTAVSASQGLLEMDTATVQVGQYVNTYIAVQFYAFIICSQVPENLCICGAQRSLTWL